MLRKKKSDLDDYTEEVTYRKFAKRMRDRGYKQAEGSRFQPTTVWERGGERIEVAHRTEAGRQSALQWVNKEPLTKRLPEDVEVEIKSGPIPAHKTEPVQKIKPKKQKSKKKKKIRYEEPKSYPIISPFGEPPSTPFAGFAETFGAGMGGPMDMSEAFGYGGGPSGIFGADFLGMGYEPERKPRKRKPKRSQAGQSAGTGNQPIVIVVRDND